MDELVDMINRLCEVEELSDWEANFVDDMRYKLRRYQGDVRFSPAQEAKIRQIFKDRISKGT